MIRKSLTLSLQEKIEQRRQSGKKVYSLSNPTFNSKTLNKVSLRSYNLQGKLTGEQKLKKIAQDYLFNNFIIVNNIFNINFNNVEILTYFRYYIYISTMKQIQERWVSGLNHRFAKPAKEVIPSEGSNPSLSAMNF